jgi:hypothetical protein
MLGLLKLLAAVLFLPVVIAATQGFGEQLLAIKNLQKLFLLGALSYTVCHLFVVSFSRLYEFIQKSFGEVFRFQTALQVMVPRLIPLGPALLLIIYYICSFFFTAHVGVEYSIYYFSGFTFAMHVILSAAATYQEDNHALKGHYFFSMTLFYLGNLVIVALLLDLNFAKFSCPEFLQFSGKAAWKIYEGLLNKFIL